MQARPPRARYVAYFSCAGMPNRMPTAARTRAMPIQLMMLKMRFISRATVPCRPTSRSEQTKWDPPQVVDDVGRVDHALREVIEVLDDRQIRRHVREPARRKASE